MEASIELRSDRPYELMASLTHSSIWLLAGTTLKPHVPKQSSLASTLQQMMPTAPGKGRGKGKSKTKSTDT